jgi:hypothetical protein
LAAINQRPSGLKIQGWGRPGINHAPRHAATGEPGEIRGIKHQQPFAAHFLKQLGRAALLGLDVQAPISRSGQADLRICRRIEWLVHVAWSLVIGH